MWLWITLGIIAFLLAIALVTSYICFYLIFYSNRKKESKNTEEFPIPDGEIYEPHREQMVAWMKEVRAMPHTEHSIKSFDGLTLRGRFFEYEKGAPIELLMHGYRGTADRDLSGGVIRCHSLGHSVLLVDHRASGTSEGSVITFGVNESRDCMDWVKYITENIDSEAKIILSGVSMGAATVMMASVEPLPANVVAVLADCGYTSAKAIIKKVIKEMHLPADILYPLARLGGIIFGHFDVNKASPVEAMKKAHLPIFFVHGDTDDFVPHSMSLENYAACTAPKQMHTIHGAGHGLAYPVAKEEYVATLGEFFGKFV